LDNLRIFQPPNKQNHKPIQEHKCENSFQKINILQLIKSRSDKATPEHEKRCIYKLTCHMSYNGQTRRNLKRYQEHVRYVKTNDPQSAYALHILNNKHEYWHIHVNITSLLTPYEQLYIQSYHHHRQLIQEQQSGDHNPMYRLIYDRHAKRHPAEPPDRQPHTYPHVVAFPPTHTYKWYVQKPTAFSDSLTSNPM
jgi:hypothetical protein